MEIITYGKGKCEEFGIVYTALCLAHGYEARLVVSHIVDGHVWTEVKLDGRWVHVEPADGIIDQPYRRYDRGRQIAIVIAYEINGYEIVTLNYKKRSNIG